VRVGRRRWWFRPLIGLVVFAIGVVVVQGLLDRRSDQRVYERMQSDPTVALVPPDSEVLEQSSTGPCDGDSLTGPSVVTALSSEAPPDELIDFYQSELDRLGWTEVSIEGDELVAVRDDAGYELELRAYADSFEDIDFWVTLSTVPRQDCILPIL